MIGRVLAALDGSARARGVFGAAVEIAGRFGAVLQPLRAVVVPPEFPAAAAGTRADPLPRHMARVALEDLIRLTAVRPASVRVDPPIVRVGEAWRVIMEVSGELDVDLIVIGSHGYSTLDRLLGTTAGRVANSARRNVLVVHDRAELAEALASTRTPYR
jgi:universal stress protein F